MYNTVWLVCASSRRLAASEQAPLLWHPTPRHPLTTQPPLPAPRSQAQTSADARGLNQMGLDLVEGKVRNNVEAGVLEPAMSKVKMIQFATEAAITILRIDDLIRLAPNPDDEEH